MTEYTHHAQACGSGKQKKKERQEGSQQTISMILSPQIAF